MNFSQSFFRYLSLLSIDVVLGAMAGLLFFSRLFRVEVDLTVYLLLGSAVWCIYTLDHILDAKSGVFPLSDRYVFHQNNRTVLMVCVLAVAILGLGLAFLTFGLGKEFFWSVGLGALILATMFLIRKAGKSAGLLKEISTGVLYVLGIAWIPLLRIGSMDLSYLFAGFLFGYSLLAVINLLTLAVLDANEDHVQGFPSAADILPLVKLVEVIRRLNFLLIFVSLAGFIFLSSLYRPFACVILLMALVHYLTFFQADLSSEQKRMRMEASFMLPVLLLFL
ncbi:hypothetical protein [Algoriphagus sp.]|uniref:hypothetical protein n=1 Tax=Algoriphagus sp. TaxID=1872435 RepID=UPI00391B2BE7